ncbi:MAG TPA: hypothetical protein VMT88_08975 [Actinomycetes bacterium]|nr:hypothetical protein [Actinomycetes bacterium]
MTTLTAARVSEFPRVNLLPPEIAAAAQLKRLKGLLGLLVAMAIVVAGALYFWASGQVSSAQDDLTTAQATGSQLQAKVDTFAEVPEVLGELDAAQASLVQAMTPEIRWSFYLNDLSLTIPDSTRLETLVLTNSAAAEQVTGKTITAETPLGVPTMGHIEFGGKAVKFDSVASWLQAVAGQDASVEPGLTKGEVQYDEENGNRYVEFSSWTNLNVEAASMRFEQVLADGE